MLVGLAIGNIHSANSWVFAAAAGMFIYIALVDMMPELNCETGDPPLVKFAIQLLGMSIGATIMCLIALYEHNLQDLIEDGSWSTHIKWRSSIAVNGFVVLLSNSAEESRNLGVEIENKDQY